MKRNTKLFAAISALAMGMSLLILSCSSESSGDSGVSGNPGTGVTVEAAAGTVIRNKIIDFDDYSTICYEYLKFTSATEGEYSLYRAVEGGDNVKLSTILVDGIEYAVPTAFTFDSSTGKVSSTFAGGTSSSYIFNAKKGNEEIFCVASELFSNSDPAANLLSCWTRENGDEFTFEKNGVVTVKTSIGTYDYSFTNDSGVVTIDDIPCYFGNFGSDNRFYYVTCETERAFDVEVGRSALNSEIGIVSSKSLLGIF